MKRFLLRLLGPPRNPRVGLRVAYCTMVVNALMMGRNAGNGNYLLAFISLIAAVYMVPTIIKWRLLIAEDDLLREITQKIRELRKKRSDG